MPRVRVPVERQIGAYQAEAIRAIIHDSINGILMGAGQAVAEWAQRLAQQTDNADDAQYRENMLRTVAEAGQQSMLKSYDQLVTRNAGPEYRVGEGRLAGGILREALGREDFFTVNGSSLLWGNVAVLSEAARHWHRIAFGAGAAGTGINIQYVIPFEGLVNAVMGIVGTPSPAFTMPYGWWYEEGSVPGSSSRLNSASGRGGIFYPETNPPTHSQTAPIDISRESKGFQPGMRDHPTKGIRTHDFFSAGIRTIVKALPGMLAGYEKDIFGRISSGVSGGTTRIIRISPKPRASWRD